VAWLLLRRYARRHEEREADLPRDEGVYTEQLHLYVTRPMMADLRNVAEKSGQPLSAVVRQAIRNYLDATDLTLGTRRTFDRRFQKRMEALEHKLEQYLLALLVLTASQFAEMPGQQISGGELLKRAARLAASSTGSQVRQTVLRAPDEEAEK
jgi:hypothetical protein